MGEWCVPSSSGGKVVNDEMVKEKTTKSEKEVKCFKCGKKGHIARRCTGPDGVCASTSTTLPKGSLTTSPQNRGSFSAILDKFLCTASKTATAKQTRGLFGKKTVVPITVMGMELAALLDTGSETSMIPLSVFRRAREKKVDIDKYVKRIPRVEAIVRNASGERMSFTDTISMEVTMKRETKSVAFHVGEGLDIIILGTNALEVFGLSLGKVQLAESEEGLLMQGESSSKEARVHERMFLPSGCMKFLPVETASKQTDVFESENAAHGPGVCKVSMEGIREFAVGNVSHEPMLFQEGEVDGSWQNEDCIPRAALAEQAAIVEKSRPVSIKHDALAIIPHKMNDEVVSAVAQDGQVVDNSALSILHRCSGRRFEDGDPMPYNCTVRQMTFDSVAHVEDAVIANLSFSSIFELARLISIFESEPDLDKKRYQMRNPGHCFVTIAGIEKAFVFFKRHCDHTIRALMAHDGSNVSLTSKAGLNIDITQLNDLTNAGIRFAQAHTWDEVSVKGAVKSTLLLLPFGFRGYGRVGAWPKTLFLRKGMSVGVCIFVSPAMVDSIEETHWVRLSTVFAAQVRQGVKVVAVSGPQGEGTWDTYRQKTIDVFERIRGAAATMRQNVVTMFGQTPAFAEPCAAMGSAPRMTPMEAYPVHLIKKFLLSLQSFVAGHVQQKLFDIFDKPVNRTKFYKYTKKMDSAQARQVLRSIGMAGNTKHDVQGRSQQLPTLGNGFRGRGNRSNGHRGCDRRRPGPWMFKPY
ncbi:hypothetical protein Aduo_012941 [Ancylostoma duodenale]